MTAVFLPKIKALVLATVGELGVVESVLNVKVLVGAFNQALVGAFSVIVKSSRTFT